MHPRVYREFERICSVRNAGGAVLEIGAVPSPLSLLNMKSLHNATEKVGINLDGPYTYRDFCIMQGNANSMTCFEDDKFDTVLCNALLEHDKFFWKTISEIRRVTKPGGLVVIGAPGYVEFPIEKYVRYVFGKSRKIPLVGRYFNFLVGPTITFPIHTAPGDYYRFSRQAFSEVFFEGMRDVNICSIMLPPRIIGSGIKP